jgi:hypothetical protein
MAEEKRRAIELLCLSSPSVLAEVMAGDNMMARTHAVRQAELLRVGALEDEARTEKRAPGLSIVLIDRGGGHLVAYEPPAPPPMLDVTPTVDVVPVQPERPMRPDDDADFRRRDDVGA